MFKKNVRASSHGSEYQTGPMYGRRTPHILTLFSIYPHQNDSLSVIVRHLNYHDDGDNHKAYNGDLRTSPLSSHMKIFSYSSLQHPWIIYERGDSKNGSCEWLIKMLSDVLLLQLVDVFRVVITWEHYVTTGQSCNNEFT